MAASHDLVRRVLDGLPVGIWVAAVPGGELTFANQRFRQIMGMEARDDVAAGGYSQPYGIHDLDGAPYPEDRLPFVRAMEAGHEVMVDDIVIHRHDGGRVNVRAWATPLYDGDRMTHIAIAFSDITAEIAAGQARLASEERLRRVQRMETIGQLAGGIAHDFNNLLTAIGVVASSLGRRAPPELEADVGRILEVTERAVELARSLLGFAGRGAGRREPLDLHQLIESLVELLRRTLAQPIELRLELGAASGVVDGDRAQIEQVLMNLAINARDAIDGDGAITIATTDVTIGDGDGFGLSAGDYVLVTVEDTGPGIPPELRERVFDPYFTTKTGGARRGTGLGLATVHGIAEAHGGRARVSDGETGGARLEVAFPASRRPIISRPPTPEPRPGSGAVMVVDDDATVRAAMARALEGIGYQPLEAGSGREAVELLAGHRGELVAVLLDMVMPEMDGKETYVALRAIDPAINIILMTGFVSPERAREVRDLGAGEFLAKPFSLGDLSDRLATLPRRQP